MGQDSKGEDWEDNSRHAGDAVGSMASEAERTSWGSRSTSSSLEARAAAAPISNSLEDGRESSGQA